MSEAYRRIPVVINPAAGRGAGRILLKRLASMADVNGIRLEPHPTGGPGDAERLAAALLTQGETLIAAAGGDGTLSEVAAALRGSSCAMAIIPVGTGNDMARHLGLPLNAPAAIRGLLDWRPVLVDVGLANGRPYLVAAGCGFDAAVAAAVNRRAGALSGPLAYVVAVLQTLWRYSPTRMIVNVDGETEEFQGYFAVVANARGYGGGMKIAPNASVSDGILDVCCVRALPRWRFLLAAASVYSGRHIQHPAVTMRRGRCVRIESSPPAPVVADGELLGTTPLSVEVAPLSLTLAIPNRVKDAQ